MSFRRILLKNESGAPRASISIGRYPPKVMLPKGITPLVCLTDKIHYPPENSFSLQKECADFSLLAKMGEEILYASTLSGADAAFAKWQLLSALEDQGNLRENSHTETYARKEEIIPSEGVEELPDDLSEASPLPEECDLNTLEDITRERSDERDRIEELLEKGTPFSLFEQLMPNSRWALIEDDTASYLIGVRKDDEGEHCLFGVPGVREYPPDEGKLWSFFPVDEEGESGYFLTEYTGII